MLFLVSSKLRVTIYTDPACECTCSCTLLLHKINRRVNTSVFLYSSPPVILRLANEPACIGKNLTITCESATGSGIVVWSITDLPGVPNISNAFAQTLDTTFERITTPDTLLGPNPSIITIRSVTAADNGATVQCHFLNLESSNVITLSIRK